MLSLKFKYDEGIAKKLANFHGRRVEVTVRPSMNRVAYFIEFGTSNMVARPFFFRTVFNPKVLREGLKEVFTRDNFSMLGQHLTNEVKLVITKMSPSPLTPALKPSTIRAKGSSKLLINEGILRGGIIYNNK